MVHNTIGNCILPNGQNDILKLTNSLYTIEAEWGYIYDLLLYICLDQRSSIFVVASLKKICKILESAAKKKKDK